MSPIMKENHILLFPYMAQGHIIPFLSLALKLEQEKGYGITFVNTPLNIKKLQNNLHHHSNINLIEIPFDSTEHDLPPNSETTETLPVPLMLRLIETSPSLKPAFRNLVLSLVAGENRGTTPLCIISDMFFAWSSDVAHEFGIKHAIFNAGGGYGMAGWHTTWLNLPHLKSNTDEFWPPGFPKSCRFKTKNLPPHIQEAESSWQFALDTYQDWKKTDGMLFNTVEDIDRTGLTYFREQFPNSSIYAIGPIVSPEGSRARGGEEVEETRNLCMKWLDLKPENSVLYVAFGSQNSPSESQTIELAKALEASNTNFLWVFRPPSNNKNTKNNWFADGFEEKVNKRGLLLKKWAPQMEILSHKSIGAFLSHCGWNSIMEALSNGVPMLSWPMGGEQAFNAQFLEEEMGVSVGVANGGTCEVKCDEIMMKFKLMMEYEEGNVMRRKACKVMKIIRNANNDEKGSSAKAMEDFLNMINHAEPLDGLIFN